MEEILRQPKAVEIWRKATTSTPMQTTWKKFLKGLTDVRVYTRTRAHIHNAHHAVGARWESHVAALGDA